MRHFLEFKWGRLGLLFALMSVCVQCREERTTDLPHGVASYAYHGGRARQGWNDAESGLVPERVKTSLGPLWESPRLDTAIVGGVEYEAHLYATPLYVDDIEITKGDYTGLWSSVVFAASSNGWVYAINAVQAQRGDALVEPGTILWKANVGAPSQPLRNLDGVPFGILSTPFIDTNAIPPRMYVTCADAQAGWRASALDITTGDVLPGWPVSIDDPSLERVNQNPPRKPTDRATMADFHIMSQRAALNVSPTGSLLYVAFGSYFDGAIGWMVAIDTASPRVVASFSGASTNVPPPAVPPTTGEANLASAGMWGAGGAAIDGDGRVFTTTGNSPEDSGPEPGVWGNSVLQFKAPLALEHSYSPFNYCLLDKGDTDLGGSSPVVFDLDPAVTSTPHLVTFGGKQGTVYLVERDKFAGSTNARPPCDVNAPPSPSTDTSLLPPDPLSIYTPPSRGPLNVFGPYSEGPLDNQRNNAKMRTTPALLRDERGQAYVFVSGNSRDPGDISKVVPPSLVRLKVVTSPGQPAYLAVDGAAPEVVFKNPGSPVVSSFHGTGAIVWVLDENGTRADALVPSPGFQPPRAILYAFDAGLGSDRMALLWKSDPIGVGGKYNHPVIAHGAVIVGADKIQAFGLR